LEQVKLDKDCETW